jgi:hypothetical protein
MTDEIDAVAANLRAAKRALHHGVSDHRNMRRRPAAARALHDKTLDGSSPPVSDGGGDRA